VEGEEEEEEGESGTVCRCSQARSKQTNRDHLSGRGQRATVSRAWRAFPIFSAQTLVLAVAVAAAWQTRSSSASRPTTKQTPRKRMDCSDFTPPSMLLT
jgi:hypothetical protein